LKKRLEILGQNPYIYIIEMTGTVKRLG